jgi:DNA-binding NtrC family response regulator
VHPQLLVLVVQPNDAIGRAITGAMSASGHEALMVATATWAVGLVREDPPDVVLLERSAAGYERLLDALDSLGVSVPVVVTRFKEVPSSSRCIDPAQVAALVRQVEEIAWQL